MDESISYSFVIRVHFKVSISQLSIYPNPANNYLSVSAEYGTYKLFVLTDQGQLIQTVSFAGNTYTLYLKICIKVYTISLSAMKNLRLLSP